MPAWETPALLPRGLTSGLGAVLRSTRAAPFFVTGSAPEEWLPATRRGVVPMDEFVQNPMSLLTPELREQLLANGRQPDVDHVPVVKFFNAVGIGTWLATELDADGDTLFGLAQLNDAPELGTFSLEELSSLRLPFGMHIERDIFFVARFRSQPMPKPLARPAASPPRGIRSKAMARTRGTTTLCRHDRRAPAHRRRRDGPPPCLVG